MANDLVVFESQLRPMAPMFTEALAGTFPVERLIRTAVISAERTPKLLQCTRQSLFNAVMSAAVLGLEMDGVTGQAFIIPFADRAQLLIGYKGMNTLGARAGLTITGEVVREGDAFDYDLGEGWVKHKPAPTGKGRIIYAWAKAAAMRRPAIVTVLPIDDIMAIKERSPGARKSESPWNDPAIGFPAMASKSAKRRLARSTPLTVMTLAARMEEVYEEQGRHSFIKPGGQLVIEGDGSIAPRETSPHPSAAQLMAPPRNRILEEAEEAAALGREKIKAFMQRIPADSRAALEPHRQRLWDKALEADRESSTL